MFNQCVHELDVFFIQPVNADGYMKKVLLNEYRNGIDSTNEIGEDISKTTLKDPDRRILYDTPEHKEEQLPMGSSGIVLHAGMRARRLGGC